MITEYTGPKTRIDLQELDGNAFAIMGGVMKAMRKQGIPKTTIDAYAAEAKSGNYDHLLQVSIEYTEPCDDD